METSLEALTQYILTQAQSEADALLARAKDESEKTLADTRQRLDERLIREKEHFKRLSDQRIEDAQRQKASALRRIRTQYARELVERLFDQAEEALCGLDGERFLQFYKNALASLPLQGAYTVRLGGRSAANLSEAERKALAIKTETYSVTVCEDTVPNEGGFLLEQPPVEMSFLFSDLLKELKSADAPGLIKGFLG